MKPRKWVSDTEAWLPFLAAWNDRGLWVEPSPAQRSALWSVIDSRPEQAARWVAEAPEGASPGEVIGYVLDRWRGVREAVPPDRRPDITPRSGGSSSVADILGSVVGVRQGGLDRSVPSAEGR